MLDVDSSLKIGSLIRIDNDEWDEVGKFYEVLKVEPQYTTRGELSTGVVLTLIDKSDDTMFRRVVPENQIVVL